MEYGYETGAAQGPPSRHNGGLQAKMAPVGLGNTLTPRGVHTAVERLSQNAEQLHAILSELEKRLEGGGVLQHPSPETDASDARPVQASGLAESVMMNAERIAVAVRRIQETLRRLDV